MPVTFLMRRARHLLDMLKKFSEAGFEVNYVQEHGQWSVVASRSNRWWGVQAYSVIAGLEALWEELKEL